MKSGWSAEFEVFEAPVTPSIVRTCRSAQYFDPTGHNPNKQVLQERLPRPACNRRLPAAIAASKDCPFRGLPHTTCSAGGADSATSTLGFSSPRLFASLRRSSAVTLGSKVTEPVILLRLRPNLGNWCPSHPLAANVHRYHYSRRAASLLAARPRKPDHPPPLLVARAHAENSRMS